MATKPLEELVWNYKKKYLINPKRENRNRRGRETEGGEGRKQTRQKI